MNMTLYQVSSDYLTALHDLTEAEQNLDDVVVKDTLDSLIGDFEVKAQNVAMFIRNLETTAEAIKQAESEMAKRRKAIENQAERLKAYLKLNMELTGISKIECPYFKISIAKNPASVEIMDESIIPNRFKKTVEVTNIDKTAIKAALSNNFTVPGAKLANGTRLVIK